MTDETHGVLSLHTAACLDHVIYSIFLHVQSLSSLVTRLILRLGCNTVGLLTDRFGIWSVSHIWSIVLIASFKGRLGLLQ